MVFPSERFPWDRVGEVFYGLNKRFYSKWLPTSGPEQENGMNLEIHGGDDIVSYLGLWYAVRKK